AGAIVALWAAAQRPDLVEKLVLVSGAFHPDGLLFRPHADSPPPEPLAAAYAEVSPDGRDHFPVVVAKIARAAEELTGLTPDELGEIACPTLVMAADDDMVALEHTIALYRGLREAQLAIVPGTSHLMLHENPALCAGIVREFLTGGPAV